MKYFFLNIIFVFLTFISFSQSRDELENKRRNSLKQIEYTSNLIKETEKNRKHSYNKLLLLNKNISIRENLIKSINDELNYLDDNILMHQDLINTLESDLQAIKREYARLIYYSYLHRSNYDKLMFIFASDNINQAFKRLKYLQQYSEYRVAQAKKIEETKEELGNKIVELEILKADKKDLLVQQQIEQQKLFIEKQKSSKEVKLFTAKENDLKLKLRKQNKIAERLQREIERIIEEEARKAAAKNKNAADYFKLTPEEKLIASTFYKNKNHLPWPTERGVVTGNFGVQPHPFLKGIKIQNNGIDISTTQGAVVRAIFDGTVTGVFVIKGVHKTVIIRHGNYLSVYSNLKDVIVKKGDKVKTKQAIGVVYTENESDHKTVLKFQIWQENKKLNPTDWLAKSSHE
jgi:septal ring factor EnvC (AmiA/AmiB activator)